MSVNLLIVILIMKCPKCDSKTYVKAGFIRKKQRFLCKKCECQFTQDFVGKYGQDVKLQALKLYKEGNGFENNFVKF
jgi:transposase-like protein